MVSARDSLRRDFSLNLSSMCAQTSGHHVIAAGILADVLGET